MSTHGKRPSGRPKLPANQRRSNSICVRFSADEESQIRHAAGELGITAGEYIRIRTLGYRAPSPPVPEINRAKYAELAPLAANLNQLAHFGHKGMYVIVDQALLTKCLSELQALRQDLLGIDLEDTKE